MFLLLTKLRIGVKKGEFLMGDVLNIVERIGNMSNRQVNSLSKLSVEILNNCPIYIGMSIPADEEFRWHERLKRIININPKTAQLLGDNSKGFKIAELFKIYKGWLIGISSSFRPKQLAMDGGNVLNAMSEGRVRCFKNHDEYCSLFKEREIQTELPQLTSEYLTSEQAVGLKFLFWDMLNEWDLSIEIVLDEFPIIQRIDKVFARRKNKPFAEMDEKQIIMMFPKFLVEHAHEYEYDIFDIEELAIKEESILEAISLGRLVIHAHI